MLDERPSAAELIAAVADFIEKQAAPQLDAHTAFHAKVALNVLRIVEREIERDRRGGADDAELVRLRGLCRIGEDAGITALNRELCERIADGRIAIDDPALLEHLMLSVLDRIAVDNPKYASLSAVTMPGTQR
jgi:hypothetical protein